MTRHLVVPTLAALTAENQPLGQFRAASCESWAKVGGSPSPAAAQQLPPHLGQHVADFVEELVRLAEHAIGFRTASRLPVSLFPIFDARDHAGDFGN